MKKSIVASVLAACLLFSSCIGSFRLTNNLYSWNNSIGSKWANTLVFAAFVIIPVYGFTLFIDAIILNSIEFWGGNSPVSMTEGEIIHKTIKGSDGSKYQLTLTKNHIDISNDNGEQLNMVYDESDLSWNVSQDNELVKLVQLIKDGESGEEMVRVYKPDGQFTDFSANSFNSKDVLKEFDI